MKTMQETKVRSLDYGTRYRRLFRVGNALMMRPMLRSRIGERMHDLALITITGRRTGKRYVIPVACYEADGERVILTASPWKANLRGGAEVEIHAEGRTRTMHAELVEDPDEVADVYAKMLRHIGVKKAPRIGLRVSGETMPTHHELVQALGGVRSIVRLTDR